MKTHENYSVVFKDGRQIAFYKPEDAPKELNHGETIKEVNFNPTNSACYLDAKGNIVLTIIKNIENEVEKNVEIPDCKKYIQYMMAFLIKNKIFSYAVALDDGKISPEKFYETIESSLDFKIDDTYAELVNLFGG